MFVDVLGVSNGISQLIALSWKRGEKTAAA